MSAKFNYKVYRPHAGNAVLVFDQSPKTIKYVAINDLLQYDIFTMRVLEFHKDFTPVDYSPAKFAFKVLTSTNITRTPEVQKVMEEIIMETANIIVITPNCELVGRFADEATAAQAAPENALVIKSVADLDIPAISKTMLIAALGEAAPQGKVSKTELTTLVYNKFAEAEVAIPEGKKGKKAKEPKPPREKSTDSVNARIRTALAAGEFVVLEDIAQAAGKSIATTRTQLNVIKHDEKAPLKVVHGVVGGKSGYVLEEHIEKFQFDAKPEKAAKEPGAPRAPKTDGPVYKVHAFLNANPDMSRKDAIAKLVEQGINKSTATTQYGAWKTARTLATAGTAEPPAPAEGEAK